MANESKVIQIGTIDLHGMTNDAHFMYMKDVENAMETDKVAKTMERIQANVAILKAAVDKEDEYLNPLEEKSVYRPDYGQGPRARLHFPRLPHRRERLAAHARG